MESRVVLEDSTVVTGDGATAAEVVAAVAAAKPQDVAPPTMSNPGFAEQSLTECPILLQRCLIWRWRR